MLLLSFGYVIVEDIEKGMFQRILCCNSFIAIKDEAFLEQVNRLIDIFFFPGIEFLLVETSTNIVQRLWLTGYGLNIGVKGAI